MSDDHDEDSRAMKANTLLENADALFEQQDFGQAEAAYRQVFADHFGDLEGEQWRDVAFQIGICCFMNDNLDGARQMITYGRWTRADFEEEGVATAWDVLYPQPAA